MNAAARRAAALARREATTQSAPALEPSRDAAELVESFRPVEPAAPTKPCKSCGAPVVWIETAAGQRMPLDPAVRRGHPSHAAPEGSRRIGLVTDGGVVVSCVEHPEGAVTGRVSHFASCPHADEHRRPRESKPRPSSKRRAAPAPVPALPPEPSPATPPPTEPAGARVAVVRAPIGPPCTVRTDDGALVEGHRVPDDFAGGDTVHRGECVTVHERVQGQVNAAADGATFRVMVDRKVLVARPAVPPPLPSRTS